MNLTTIWSNALIHSASNNTKTHFTQESSEIASVRVKESSFTTMAESMKESGLMINATAEASNGSKMGIHSKVNFKEARLTERGSSHGRTGRYTMASGLTESKRAMAYGKVSMVIPISVNGKLQRPMGMEFMFGEMETVMRGSGGLA